MRVFRHKKLCVPLLLIDSQKVSTSNVVKAGFDFEKKVSPPGRPFFRSLIQPLRHYWSIPFENRSIKVKQIANFFNTDSMTWAWASIIMRTGMN